MAGGNCPIFGSKLIGSFETVPEMLTGNSVVEAPVPCEESLDPSPANMSHAERHETRTVKIMHCRIEITPAAALHQLCQNDQKAKHADSEKIQTGFRDRIDPDRLCSRILYQMLKMLADVGCRRH